LARKLFIQCPQAFTELLVDALNLYAKMAFPDSGSPCQMVSRQALTDAAEQFSASWHETGQGEISSRMRPMLNAAIKNYFQLLAQQNNMSTEHQCQLVLQTIKSGRIDEQQWQQAVELDRLAQLK
jgi:hypothetical protein